MCRCLHAHTQVSKPCCSSHWSLWCFHYFNFCILQVMLSTITVLCSLRTALWTYLSLRRVPDLQMHLITHKENQESWVWPAQTVKSQGQQKACHQHTSPTVSEAWCHVLSDRAATLPSTSFLRKSYYQKENKLLGNWGRMRPAEAAAVLNNTI